MTIDFATKIKDGELGTRIRAILGVPEEILENDVVSSPTFKDMASNYVNKSLKDFSEEEISGYKEILFIAYLYYICYLLCIGMYSRLPKQMENKSTKTIMQTIDWDSLALEMLNKCNDTIDSVMYEIDDEFEYGNTFTALTDESEYPNTSI